MDSKEDMLMFFNRHSVGLYRYARLFLVKEDAEDVVSDTILKFYVRYRHKYDESDIGKVLKKALFHNMIKFLSRQKKEVSYDEDKETYDAFYHSVSFEEESDDRTIYIPGALEFLTPYQKILINGIFYMNMSRQELAHILDTKTKNIDKAVERALENIKQYIEEASGKTPEKALFDYTQKHAYNPKSKIAVPELSIVDGHYVRR